MGMQPSVLFVHALATKGPFFSALAPLTDGYGIISNITYENLTMHYPVWWGIYIGPQQQEQPGGHGPGCMIYPIDDNCPTQVGPWVYFAFQLSPMGFGRADYIKPCLLGTNLARDLLPS